MAIGTQVASLFGLIDIDDKLTPGLDKAKGNMGSFATTLGNGIKNIGGQVTKLGIGATAIGVPFLAFGANAVNSAGESQIALAQLEAVLASTGGAAGLTSDQLVGMADGLQTQTRYSDESVMSAENLLLTFTNLHSDVFPDVLQSVLDVSTAMGQDLSTSSIQLGKALNNPAEGLTALTRIGVTFDEGQRAMIESMMAAGDTAGAQKIILQELQREFGGSAVAAGETFPGKMDILKNKFDEVNEKIGYSLINVLDPLTTTLGDLATGFSNLDAPTQDAITKIILIGAGFAVAGPIIAGVGTVITALGTAVAFALSPVGLLIIAIGGLIYVLNEKYPGGISKLLSDAGTAARQLADIFFMSLVPGASGAQDAIDKAVMSLAQLQVIVGLLKGGQITLPQVLQQIGYELTGGDSAHQVISPSSGGGSRGFGGSSSSGIVVNGPVSINANNTNQFESELHNRVRSRG